MNHLLALILALLTATSYFFAEWRAPLQLFPTETPHFAYRCITDDSCQSSADYDISHNHLHFRYQLDSLAKSPTAALLFHTHELYKPIDISKYDHIEVVVDSTETNDFTLTLSLFQPGISTPNKVETHQPVAVKVRATPDRGSFCLPLNDFATPHRWFQSMPNVPIKAPDFKQCTHLSFSNFGDDQRTTTQRVSLVSLSFSRCKERLLRHSSLAGFLLFLSIEIFFLTRKGTRNRIIKNRIYYGNKLSLSEEQQTEKLLVLCREHYDQPHFSLQFIEEELRLKPAVVNDLLKKETGLHYKQYLNTLRIEKAQTLLKDSAIPISTVANMVGYSYANSFSRLFRQNVGSSPLQYRNTHQR